jgi:bifunctional non-homologous end joining protein LigD
LGALRIGLHPEQGQLRYAGKVGTGFDTKTLQSVMAELKKRATDKPPFADPPTGAEGRRAHWVKPDLVAEIAFTEWTRDNTLRHPSFQGLRKDKRARDVVRERPEHVASEDDGAAAASAKRATGNGSAARGTSTQATRAPRSTPAEGNAAKRAPATRAAAATPRPAAAKAIAGNGAVVAGVALSNPEKVLYPEAQVTKRELAEYYAAIGERMVPHVRDRPLTLVRCPNGWSAKCFYQKHVKESLGDFLQPVEVPEANGTATYMMANSIGALVSLVQMGVLEIHPWGSRAGALDHPDVIVMDFDPEEALPWSALVDAVTVLRKLLDTLGLTGFLKTTGGKGLHVVLPIEPRHDWEVIRTFTKALADLMVLTFPDRFTAKLTKSTRTGRIFVDYLRNAEGATAIAPYSARAKRNAPVAMPIGWEDLATDVRFDHFNVRNVPALLRKRRKDPWAGFFTLKQSITADMLRRLGAEAADQV